MDPYDPKVIEAKWQTYWEDNQTFLFEPDSRKKKFYVLMEFPYPSGDGLHTGHVRGYTAMDIIARKRRMEGYNVLYPIGWDAFGLPTENYAIKTGINPIQVTKERTDVFRTQFKSLGLSFDWSREINTTDPKYYKWTQWLFLQFLKHDLAYKAKATINWCPKDKIGLANEEVVHGCCERCGTPVEKREKEQWMLAITKYAERLDKDLDTVNYQEKIKTQQRNWIGKSEGVEINFQVKKEVITVFTTRPDTIFGATYIAVSPEVAKKWIDIGWPASDAIRSYIDTTLKERVTGDFTEKEKTGIFTEFYAINPATKKEIPVWIVNYVLGDVGTGAIMAVPSDDERDAEFAQKFGLPIITDYSKAGFEDFGKKVTRFKLRDWVFSRQRYWGEPIPVIHCATCGIVPVPEKDLPVILPEVDHYVPSDNGESPLAAIAAWVNVPCPTCGAPAKRETDVMPNWAGSSWYFLRYCDPHNIDSFANFERLKETMPVDWYNGGMEHTTLHLLYSRFWNKFLFDIGLVPTLEPYEKRTSHGLILAEGGVKMSKSIGNVINPDGVVKLYGTDTLRVYEMFMGPFSEPVAWSTESIIGPRRFIEKVWKIGHEVVLRGKSSPGTDTNEFEVVLNKTIQKVTNDIEEMSFNTAVSAMMICVNVAEKHTPNKSQFERFLQLLAPFAPHVCEELWSLLGNSESIQKSAWPLCDESKLVSNTVTIIVQVNSKVRASFTADLDTSEEHVTVLAIELPEVKKWLTEGYVKRVIFVKNKLVNFVI